MKLIATTIAQFLMLVTIGKQVLGLSSRRISLATRNPLATAAALQMVSSTATTTTTATAENPLLVYDGLPKFGSIEPSNLTPAVEELLEQVQRDFNLLEEDLTKRNEEGTIDYDGVLPRVEKMQYPIGFVWGVAGHLNGVKNGDELREAYESNQPKVVQSMTQFSQSKPLYDALTAIEKQWKEDGEGKDDDVDDGACPSSFLMQQKRRAVENSLLEMKLGGVGLAGEEKERFNEIKQKLAKLSTTFSNNVLDDTKAFSFTVENIEKMDGVPQSAKALWASSHAEYMKTKNTEASNESEDDTIMDLDKAAKNGPWRITLDIPSYLPVMSHIRDRNLRETIYKAYIKRASEVNQEKNNIPLIYEILSLKQEMARLLGFDNYAELSLAKKMAPSVNAVTELTDLMAKKAIPAARKELEEITALARKQGGEEYSVDKLEKLAPWDTTFWVRK